jgi:Uma2 family endonuclease
MSVMPTTSALMTVEQYSALPDPKGGRYELHHGVLVEVTFPKMSHWFTQQRLTDLLKPLAKGQGRVGPEFAFRPLPEHELWAADVAFVSQSRIDATPEGDYVHGAPELVIEVLSPSNTAAEMNEREAMCLENGCLEFWVIDPKRKTVKVSTPDRKSITYVEGEKIPLKVPAAGELAVAEIFSND